MTGKTERENPLGEAKVVAGPKYPDQYWSCRDCGENKVQQFSSPMNQDTGAREPRVQCADCGSWEYIDQYTPIDKERQVVNKYDNC